MQSIKTLIFDMDGVIFDTESLVLRCWRQLADQYHLSNIEPVFLSAVGTTRKHTGDIMRAHYGSSFPYEEFDRTVSKTFHAIADVEGIPVKPGVRELLSWASENNYRIGLASSTRQVTVERELKQANLYHYFDCILGGDQIARSKPFPDIYLTACRNMNVNPTEAYAIEDSYNGIRSASAAGMQPIMIPDMLPPTEEMHLLCRAIYPNLSEFLKFLSE